MKKIYRSGPQLSNNKWHQVHLFRHRDHVNITIDGQPLATQCKCFPEIGPSQTQNFIASKIYIERKNTLDVRSTYGAVERYCI